MDASVAVLWAILDVPAEVDYILRGLHGDGLETSFKQRSRSLLSFVDRLRVRRRKRLHHCAELIRSRTDQQVIVIRHQTPGQHIDLEKAATLLQFTEEEEVVFDLKENGLVSATAVVDVVTRIGGELDLSSRHDAAWID